MRWTNSESLYHCIEHGAQLRTINTITREKGFCPFSEKHSCVPQPLLESFFYLMYLLCEYVRIRLRRNPWNTLINFSIRFSVLGSCCAFTRFILFPLFLHPMKQIFPLSVLNANNDNLKLMKVFHLFLGGSGFMNVTLSFCCCWYFCHFCLENSVFVVQLHRLCHLKTLTLSLSLSLYFSSPMFFAQTFANDDDDDDDEDGSSDGSLKVLSNVLCTYFPLRINKSWSKIIYSYLFSSSAHKTLHHITWLIEMHSLIR